MAQDILRIGNFSGFYGDRAAAARQDYAVYWPTLVPDFVSGGKAEV
jgi:hypothetical protein